MVIDVLTDEMIKKGRALLKALDQANVSINAALWVREDDWKLVIAGPEEINGPRAFYSKIQKVLRRLPEEERISLSKVFIVPRNHVLLRMAGQAFHIEGDEGGYVSGTTVNGYRLPDMLIYRLRVKPSNKH